jgi:hypothetical protein
MPWYWTDDLARMLLTAGRISEDEAARLIAQPVAIRRSEAHLEEAAEACAEDGEIPLAA